MPIGSVSPFRPTGTVSVSASSVSANIRLSGGGDSVVVTNTSSGLAYIRFGSDVSVVRHNIGYADTGKQPTDPVGE